MEIDLFDVLSTDPDFASSGAAFGVTYMLWSFLANRTLTNGAVLAGETIYGADILIATDRLAAFAPGFTREQQLRLFQRLLMHELGHAIGLHHPHDGPTINFDSDTNPDNAILVDPADPLAGMALSLNLDTLAVMNQIPSDLNALFYVSPRNDDRGGRDVLYPALGATQDVCQPSPQPSCRAALKSKIQIRDDASDDTKDKLLWKWVKGERRGWPTSARRMDRPATRSACIAAHCRRAWRSLPCLRVQTGCRSPTRASSTATRCDSRTVFRRRCSRRGRRARRRSILKAKGTNLPDGLLPVGTTPVVAQLVRADTMGCWQGAYEAAGVTADDGSEFKANQ